METLFLMCVGYLLGSIPSAKLVSSRYGIDIQKKGSGNVGFANVYRVIGPRPAYFVLAVDVLKGFLPAFLASQLVSPNQAIVVGSMAILGHVFPVWLKFRGGKGVATACGVLLALYPIVVVVPLAVYVFTLATWRVFPLASIAAAISLPIAGAVINPEIAYWLLALSIFGIWTHRSNIRAYRLQKGATT